MSLITFLLPAFHEEWDFLVSLGSLKAQTNPHWKAIVLHNGPNRKMAELISYHFGTDSRISFYYSQTNSGNGLVNKDYALRELVDTPWVIFSSIQDYYFPKTVEEIALVEEENELVYFNSYNHLWLENAPLYAELRIRGIDWGQFAIRTEIAKQINQLTLDDNHADGEFIEKILENNPDIRKIHLPKILTVHS
jgi:hypothetical protein